MKAAFHEQHETQSNSLSTIMKESKQIYYTKYFEITGITLKILGKESK